MPGHDPPDRVGTWEIKSTEKIGARKAECRRKPSPERSVLRTHTHTQLIECPTVAKNEATIASIAGYGQNPNPVLRAAVSLRVHGATRIASQRVANTRATRPHGSTSNLVIFLHRDLRPAPQGIGGTAGCGAPLDNRARPPASAPKILACGGHPCVRVSRRLRLRSERVWGWSARWRPAQEVGQEIDQESPPTRTTSQSSALLFGHPTLRRAHSVW